MSIILKQRQRDNTKFVWRIICFSPGPGGGHSSVYWKLSVWIGYRLLSIMDKGLYAITIVSFKRTLFKPSQMSTRIVMLILWQNNESELHEKIYYSHKTTYMSNIVGYKRTYYKFVLEWSCLTRGLMLICIVRSNPFKRIRKFWSLDKLNSIRDFGLVQTIMLFAHRSFD